MYFNDNKSDTNIDDDFKEKNNILSSVLSIIKKFKIVIFIVLALIIALIMIFLFVTRDDKSEKIVNYLLLEGSEEVTIYQGLDYIETGYRAYNSKNEDLTSDVIIESTLNINVVGEYEIIYKLGNITEVRKIKVVEKPKEHTYIYLKSVDNSVNVYLEVGEKYVEPGYQVFSSSTDNLTDKVTITGKVDTTKKGSYKLVYSVVNTDNVTVSASRLVVVMDLDISLSIANQDYTNDSVSIDVLVEDEYFDYFVLPNNDMVTTNKYSYKVTDNGKYTFTAYSKKGMKKEATIEVKNIDKELPTGSCIVEVAKNSSTISINASDNIGIDKYVYNNKEYTTNTIKISSKLDSAKITIYDGAGNTKNINCSVDVIKYDETAPSGSCVIDQGTSSSTITINASDNVGIDKYVYNNKTYTSNTIKVSSKISSAKVKIYDTSSNVKEISCTLKQKVYINNIQKDGVIVTVNAGVVNTSIVGYYFSYNSTRPNKSTGAYVSTSNESIDVVRLPGTTYVWVEDKNGNISSSKTVTISTDALLITTGSSYKMLQNKSLEKYLKEQGWSLEELNKLMARSVRAAGLYTKTAAATAAVTLQTVLAQKYKIILPYWWGGKSWDIGADSSWGSYRYKINESSGMEYLYDGLDCTGFTTWAYVNAGYDVYKNKDKPYPAYLWNAWWSKAVEFNKTNGEVGDFLVVNTSGREHVKLIIGKTSTGYITAEARGGASGMVVDIHSFSKPNSYKIEKGELMMEDYDKFSRSSYPTGF